MLLCLVSQLAVVMWLLTYVGAVFNGITILILGKHHGTLYLCHIYSDTSDLYESKAENILVSDICIDKWLFVFIYLESAQLYFLYGIDLMLF